MSTQGCFTHDQADEFLDKLANDQQFREQFLGNPALVLATMGVKLDPSLVPSVRRLPSKEAIQASREAIKSKLVGTAGLPMFLLD